MASNSSRHVRKSPLRYLLLALLILAVALPVLAMPPDERDIHSLDVLSDSPDREIDVVATPPDLPLYEKQGLGLQAEPQWVPSGAKPGFYAVRDWRDLPADEHGFIGSHYTFYWDELEPAEGAYNWAPIEKFLNEIAPPDKQGALGIITFNGRANEGSDADPPLRTPAWVFAAGAQKVQCAGRGSQYPVGDPRHTNPPFFEIPAYWDPIYQAKYRNFIAALANQYDGDPRIEFIQIGVGKYGETQPCDDNKPGDYMDDDCVLAAWQAVDPSATKWTWGAVTVKQITDIYADNFHSTKLLLPNAPTFFGDSGGRKEWTDDAISRGVGLFPAGLMAIQEWVDLRNYTSPGVRYTGIFDRILDHIEAFEAGTGPEQWVNASGRPIALSQEAYHYMSPSAIEFYWAVLGALRRRMDYITVEHNLLYSGEGIQRPDFSGFVDVMKWASRYMGKHLADTPSVWVALREAGYKDSWYPQKGNYSWFLYQDDNISGGKTVATTYRTKQQLVHPWDWDYYGEAATVRAEIETGQSFLGPSYEGWICRRTDQGTGNPRMFFKIDDKYAYGGPGPTTITVTYFDGGTDSWRLVYDAAGNANKVAGTVTKTGSNWWKTHTFTINDGFFGNLQLGGADFYIDSMNDGNEYIHKVDVSVAGGSNTATPTATRDPNITPSATPTPSRTPTPSNTPVVTPTPAVVNLSPLQDTYLDEWYPDTNHGSEDRLKPRADIWNTLIEFNTGSIPTNSTVQRATLHLYLDWYEHQTHLAPVLSAYKVKQDWQELQATWNHRLTGIPWGAGGASSSADRELTTAGQAVITTNSTWYQWDVTSLVQDWVWNPLDNQGLLLLSDSARELRFHSKNASQNQPYLHIEYTVGGGPGPSATPTRTSTGVPGVTPTATTVSFQGASQDTYINSGAPDENYENRGLRVYAPGWKKSLLDFNVGSQIPAGARIESATLRLTAGTYDDGKSYLSLDIGAYLVYRNWVANQATWNLATSGTSWGSPGCNGVPSDHAVSPASVVTVQEISTGTNPHQVKTYDWDVTSIVQAWVDDPAGTAGLVLLAPPDAPYRDIGFFDSAYLAGEGGEALHPLLIVQWSMGPTTPTPTATLPPGQGAVGGTVYHDLDADGVRDVGELGFPGATVELWSGNAQARPPYTTLGSGNYAFTALAPGGYTVKLIPPAGYAASTWTQRAVTVSAGQTTSVDWGVFEGDRRIHLPLIRK